MRQLLDDDRPVADAVGGGAAAIRGDNGFWISNLLQLWRFASCFQAQTPPSLSG
jgi:hypothetical protein